MTINSKEKTIVPNEDLKNVFIRSSVEGYVSRRDWRTKENANTNFSMSGLMLHCSEAVIGNYCLNYIYPQEVKQAHLRGEIHIHDLGHGLVAYCNGLSFPAILKEGIIGIPGKTASRPARRLSSLVGQIVNIIGIIQMEFAGAMALNSVDLFLAPYVRWGYGCKNKNPLSYSEVKQSIQELVYQLNIPSRWGSQAPFTNFTFDLTIPEKMRDRPVLWAGKEQKETYRDFQLEMNLINKAFIEVMTEGDAHGRIFTFPIPTYNLTEDFPWDNNDITHNLFEMTAKYGLPYFQNFIGSNLDPSDVRTMCCRLRIDQRESRKRFGGSWGNADFTGSIGVITINVNRIALESNNKKDFMQKLLERMTLAKDCLEIKRKLIHENLALNLMPYTKRYQKHFKNHFSTIGVCGFNEACLNLLGGNIVENSIFVIEILQFMRQKCEDFQEETGNLYNLEETPAESTAFRFARLDKKYYPAARLSGRNDVYLTNSSHLPVDSRLSLLEAIKHQEPLKEIYTGGTMFHVFLGERLPSADSCKRLVRKIAETSSIPYFSITPTFSVCPNHGYLEGSQFSCPYCKSSTEVWSRITGYHQSLRHWNKGKQEEFRERVNFDGNLM